MTDLLNEPLLNVFLALVVIISKIVALVAIIVGVGFVMFAIARHVVKQTESELAIVFVIILEVIFLIPLALTLLLAVMRSLVL